MHPWVTQHPLNKDLLGWFLPVPWLIGGNQYPDVVGENHGVIATTNSHRWFPSAVGMPWKFQSGAVMSRMDCPLQYNTPDAFTVSLLFSEGTANTAARVLVCNGASSGGSLTGGWAVRAGNSGNFIFNHYNTASRLLTAVGTYAVGQNYHLCCTFDKNQDFKRIYINGALNISTTTGGISGFTTTGMSWCGFNGSAAVNGRTQALGDVRIYNRALSSGEVSNLYAECFAGNPNTFCAPWALQVQTGRNNVAAPTGVFVRRGLYLRTGSRGAY